MLTGRGVFIAGKGAIHAIPSSDFETGDTTTTSVSMVDTIATFAQYGYITSISYDHVEEKLYWGGIKQVSRLYVIDRRSTKDNDAGIFFVFVMSHTSLTCDRRRMHPLL